MNMTKEIKKVMGILAVMATVVGVSGAFVDTCSAQMGDYKRYTSEFWPNKVYTGLIVDCRDGYLFDKDRKYDKILRDTDNEEGAEIIYEGPVAYALDFDDKETIAKAGSNPVILGCLSYRNPIGYPASERYPLACPWKNGRITLMAHNYLEDRTGNVVIVVSPTHYMRNAAGEVVRRPYPVSWEEVEQGK